MYKSPNWEKLSDDKKEALEMTAHKIGRILNGDAEYKIVGMISLDIFDL